VLAAVADDDRPMIARDPSMLAVMALADQVGGLRRLYPDHRRERGRQGGDGAHLHKRSRRAEKPFISVNCAAIPENLLESELFGTRRAPSPGALARPHRQVRGGQRRHPAAR
jgi:hypothetical protein